MAKVLTLKFDATCIDCGREIPAGDKGRWIGRGRVTCCVGDADGCKADADAQSSDGTTMVGTKGQVPGRYRPAQDKPQAGSTYRLTGPRGVGAISNGSTWADSKVDLDSDDDQNGRGHERESSARTAQARELPPIADMPTEALLALMAGISAELLARAFK